MSIQFQNNFSWRNSLSLLAQAFIDFIFPPACANCGQAGALFCDKCKAAITWLESPICDLCGKPTPYPVSRCRRCRDQSLTLEKIRAAAVYRGPVAKVLRRMKYEGYFGLTGELAAVMVEAWPRWDHPIDIVVPIPLYPDRERKRGYNQAALLVSEMSEQLGMQMDAKSLVRIRNTIPQVGLTMNERRENVYGAFRVETNVFKDQRVMLVDDVCTTGSTLAAAAGALLAADAKSVTAYCLTTADNDQDITIA